MQPPRSTRTVPLFPHTTLVRSPGSSRAHACRRPADAGANQHHDPAGQSTHRGGGNDPPPCRSAEGHGYGTAIATTMDGTQPCLSDSATRSEEHTSELQSLMRLSYAVFCLKQKKPHKPTIY